MKYPSNIYFIVGWHLKSRDGAENQMQGKQGKKNKSKSNKKHQSGPAQKRARVNRTLTEEYGSTTIFGLLD